MADSFIQLPTDSTGKKVDTRTEDTNSEHREVHIIGDPILNEGLAVVTNVDPSGEIYGVVVRDPNTTTIAASVGTTATNTTSLAAGVKVQDSFSSTITSHQFLTDFRGLDTYIGGAATSTFAEIMDPDNKVKVNVGNATIAVTQSGTWDEVGINDSGNSITVDNTAFGVQVQDSQASTITSHIFNTDFRGLDVYIGGYLNTTVSELANGDNRLKVDGSAVTQPVSGTVTATATDLDIRDLVNASDSVSAYQVSGANWSVNVTNPVNQGDAATALRVVVAGNSDVSVTATQTGTWNIGTVTTLTGVTNSVAAAIVDSGGAQYSTSNPLPIGDAGGSITVDISGALTSAVVTGPTLHDAADDGDAPVKVGGVAVTANPTAVSGGDRVRFTADDLGRQLVRNVQARDLIATAYATLTTGTEATFLAAGGAGVFLDCISVLCANQSNAAVNVDFRSVTAGNVEFTVEVPSGGPGGISFPVPWPQGNANNNWTVDMPDITGTTVNISGLFSKEV